MVKLDSTGLETPAIKLGEGHLSENDNGELSWNNNTLLTNAEMGYSHFVGEQWISFDGSIPAGGIPCDGRSVERNLYPDLVKWIQDNNRAISKEEYQTMLSNSYDNVPYYVLEEAPIEYKGKLWDFDTKSRDRINAAATALEVSGIETITWTAYDDSSLELTVADLKSIIATAAIRGDALHKKYRELRDAVNLAESIEEINIINWS